MDVGLRLSQLHAVSIALLRQSGESSSNLITFLIVRNKQIIIRSGGYNEHVTVEGKVFFIWQGVDVTTKPSTVLVHKYRNTRRRVEPAPEHVEDRAEDRRVGPPKPVESRATQNVRMAKELLEMARAELLERDTTAATSSDPWPVRLPAAMKKPAAAMKKPAAAPAPVAEAATVAPRREEPAWDFLTMAPRSPRS